MWGIIWIVLMSPFSWQGQNLCKLSLANILYIEELCLPINLNNCKTNIYRQMNFIIECNVCGGLVSMNNVVCIVCKLLAYSKRRGWFFISPLCTNSSIHSDFQSNGDKCIFPYQVFELTFMMALLQQPWWAEILNNTLEA